MSGGWRWVVVVVANVAIFCLAYPLFRMALLVSSESAIALASVVLAVFSPPLTALAGREWGSVIDWLRRSSASTLPQRVARWASSAVNGVRLQAALLAVLAGLETIAFYPSVALVLFDASDLVVLMTTLGFTTSSLALARLANAQIARDLGRRSPWRDPVVWVAATLWTVLGIAAVLVSEAGQAIISTSAGGPIAFGSIYVLCGVIIGSTAWTSTPIAQRRFHRRRFRALARRLLANQTAADELHAIIDSEATRSNPCP